MSIRYCDRELYKGKELHTNSWVTGYLLKSGDNRAFIASYSVSSHTNTHCLSETKVKWEVKEVDFESVCSCTGRVDGYNNPIFLNDIVLVTQGVTRLYTGVVCYDKVLCKYFLEVNKKYGMGSDEVVDFVRYPLYHWRVVGNILEPHNPITTHYTKEVEF